MTQKFKKILQIIRVCRTGLKLFMADATRRLVAVTVTSFRIHESGEFIKIK